MTKVTHVAVAILQKENGSFLLASRPKGKPWAGWWEFPGGKIEADEAPAQALIRELQEELGITPITFQSWLQRRFDYAETHDSSAKTVHLHFFFVTQWQGELAPQEGQELRWQMPSNITVEPVLPANIPIMKALALPDVYAISNMFAMGEASFFNALAQQLKNGLKLIQVREKQLNHDELTTFTKKVMTLAKPFGAQVLLNAPIALAAAIGVDGVHLSASALLQLESKPTNLLVAASCHNATELTHVEALGLDFVVLSPVAATESHPDANPLGWKKFLALTGNISIPIYALGGMVPSDLSQALSHGAQGIAMQRAAWKMV